jgi:hypothetical protein
MVERAGLALWPMFTVLCALPWSGCSQSLVFTVIATACFVRTGWDGTGRVNCECFAISTAEKANPA